MENEVPKLKTHLNYGLIAGVVLIALFILYYFLNLFTNRALQFIPIIIFIIIIIIAQNVHTKALDHNIKFGDLFAMGFKTAAVATCIYVLFFIIFLIAVPAYKEEINMRMSTAVGKAIIGELFTGVIGALIGAQLAKKKTKHKFMH